MLICVVNASTLATSSQVALWTQACALQATNHVAPAWGLAAPTVLFVDSINHVPAWAPFVVVLDDPDQANALGYHSEAPNGRVYGKVFVRPSNQGGVYVSTVLSHEIVELLGDPYVNRWADDGRGREWAVELCDAVESNSYSINGVTVSDFLLPAFFDTQAPASKRASFLGSTGPFQVARGGYAVVRSGGVPQQIFGEEYPQWRLDGKSFPAARTARRLNQRETDSPPIAAQPPQS